MGCVSAAALSVWHQPPNAIAIALVATTALAASGLLSYWFCWVCTQDERLAPAIISASITIACFLLLTETLSTFAPQNLPTCVFCTMSTGSMTVVKSKKATEGKFPTISNEYSDSRSKIHFTSTIKSSMDNLGFGILLSVVITSNLQAACLVTAAIAATGFLLLKSKTKIVSERSISSLTPPMTMAAFCGLFAFGESGQVVAACALSFSFVVTTLIEYLAIAGHVRMSRLSPLRVIAKARRSEYAATAVGILCGFSLEAIANLDWLLAVRLSITLAIIYSFVFSFFHRSRFPEIGLEAKDRENDVACSTWEKRCLAISEECGLSERQYEVLVLIAQGRSAQGVRQALSISLSTAQTHIRNIYRKVGVHSRQELITAIENTKLYGEE